MKYLLSLTLFFLFFVAEAGPKKPTITGQIPVSGNEDQPLELQLSYLTVYDPDDFFYPWGFRLTVYQGDGYTVNGTTITPAANFSGQLKVKVSVNDGDNESNKFDMTVTINPVNDPPVITGHGPLSTVENTPFSIPLSALTVTDVDNTFPNGFSLQIQPGNGYTYNGTNVTPQTGFFGELTVAVTVNDGNATSAPFNVKVNVQPGNKRPVITGQVPVATAKNRNFTITLSMLKVDDPDNSFPNDFSLTIYPESNYTFSGNVITPANNFTGTLSVKVAVNDGNSTSEIFNFQVQVKDELVISGQKAKQVLEDEKFSIALADLEVYDPNNQFPQGYRVNFKAGENYTVSGSEITIAPNYNGVLNITLNVSNGTYTSADYAFNVSIQPVNDPPSVTNFPEQGLRYSIGNGAATLVNNLVISDPDDQFLILAEIGINTETFQPGNEVLSFTNTENIKGIFDEQQGILSLVGQATFEEYQQALNSIQYEYTNLADPLPQDKLIFFKLNDGKDVSTYERELIISESLNIDIPTVFTPNGDLSNDTWSIKPKWNSDRYNNAVIRVYSRTGLLVYENQGFQVEWDGRSKGSILPADTYFYTVDFNLGYQSVNLNGTVTLLR